jgi:hypothetical protein
MKTLSTRTTLVIIVLLIVATALLLLIFPYYYLGREVYIPKSNPDLGYFLPKSLEAWFFLIAALSFLALSFFTLAFYIRREQAEGSR